MIHLCILPLVQTLAKQILLHKEQYDMYKFKHNNKKNKTYEEYHFKNPKFQFVRISKHYVLVESKEYTSSFTMP
jgi:hypothetical protein